MTARIVPSDIAEAFREFEKSAARLREIQPEKESLVEAPSTMHEFRMRMSMQLKLIEEEEELQKYIEEIFIKHESLRKPGVAILTLYARKN